LQPEPCGQPVNLQESDLTATSVTLSWDHVPTAIGYQLRFQNVTMGSGTKLRLEPPVSTISIGAAKIFPGNTYIWRIRARCADGFSDWSLNNTFTTPMRLAGDVTDVAIIYPNPSNGLFNIQLPELNGETNADIIVMDMMGRIVSLQQAVGGTTSQIELDVPGMYQLVIRSNQYSFTEQLIVQ
jgi:hypothetical protein